MRSRASVYEKQLMGEIRETPQEYLPNLLQIVRIFPETVVLKPAEDSFIQGWKEMKAGKTQPVNVLWEGIDAG